MSVWRAKVRGALAVTHHGRVEVINAICRAAFLGQLDPYGLAEALADLPLTLRQGISGKRIFCGGRHSTGRRS